MSSSSSSIEPNILCSLLEADLLLGKLKDYLYSYLHFTCFSPLLPTIDVGYKQDYMEIIHIGTPNLPSDQ